MTTLTWREQAVAAFLSAKDGLRRQGITAGPHPELAALRAALDVAEPLVTEAERARCIAIARSTADGLAARGTQAAAAGAIYALADLIGEQQ